VNYTKSLLAEVGLEPERLEMFFLSSAEGVRFAEIATEMTERARQLGPNPLRDKRGIEQPVEVDHDSS
jgi:F420-non-reducing hydrogenase iron-sulfur subunit